ncbi:MAG: flagellar hook-associated protein FlgK, partial [Candidatus Riflebacteria bacterium]|nr:flagellar hook-associated protein FlgK [Candidatus Riflebacteria bacterium]
MANSFSGLNIAKSGIFAQRAAMEVTSNNIANANTEGYTRQRAVMSSNKAYLIHGMHTSTVSPAVGNGVSVNSVEAMRDVYMNAKIVNETSTNSFNDTSNTLLKQVESIINEPGKVSIADELDQYWAAWQDLANDPSDTALRRNLIEESNSLISIFKEVDSQLRLLQGKNFKTSQGSIENQIQDCVKEINTLGQYIADLNREIARSEVAVETANELRDKRQVALEDLAELVDIDSFYNTKGELTVSVGTHTLVQHEYFKDLRVELKNSELGSTVTGTDHKGYPEYSDNPEVATAVLDHTVSLNNVTVTVSQVAKAHSQYSFLTYHPLTGPLSDFGITSGSFVINGRGFYLDAEHTTMKDLAKTINEANLGIEAHINESGQLIMNATQTGTANKICTTDGTSNLFKVLNLQDHVKAQDCIFNFGDKEYVTQGNEVSVIDGVTITLKKVGVATMDLRPTITGGKLKALLETRDGNIQTLIDGFNELAYSIMTETNSIHRIGYGLDGETNRNFFTYYQSGDPNSPYK